jgi:hypothetical protein
VNAVATAAAGFLPPPTPDGRLDGALGHCFGSCANDNMVTSLVTGGEHVVPKAAARDGGKAVGQ